jgi:dihydrofolate reductase
MLHQARTGLAIIYARSLNHCIGHAGGLPWSLPDEYEHFNQTTIGHPVIMAVHSTYFVIGGAGLISEALPLANTVFETVVDAQIEGDTFLPPLNFAEWTTELLYEHPVDRQHQFAFQVYQHSN